MKELLDRSICLSNPIYLFTNRHYKLELKLKTYIKTKAKYLSTFNYIIIYSSFVLQLLLYIRIICRYYKYVGKYTDTPISYTVSR